jgi:PUA domain protein
MVKHRHVLRKKEAKKLVEELEQTLACSLHPKIVEVVKAPPYEFLLFDGSPDALMIADHIFLSLHGLVKYHPSKRWVTVDMGAVSHIANGADVMTPGVTDADAAIQPDDLVWIQDEKNNHPLALGISLMKGEEMMHQQKGKAVQVIHHVGDDMWNIGESL